MASGMTPKQIRQVYSSWQWGAVRAQVLRRDNRTCRECGKHGGLLDVHHVVPLERGGAAYDVDNLKTLCRPCHNKAHRNYEYQPTPQRAAWDDLVAAT